jgi:hypothetical protein
MASMVVDTTELHNKFVVETCRGIKAGKLTVFNPV